MRASGVQLLGEVEGSGYQRSPSLVRRADGQILQLTPVLYAVLACVDGHRDVAAVARALTDQHGLAVDPGDLRDLIEEKLRPLGVLQGPDGVDPPVERSNPLLALRWRVIVSNPRWTTRIASPFARLFAPPVVVTVLLAFTALCGWLLFEEGLAAATRQALYQPALLLVVIGLSVVSAGFHEIGHAAACQRAGATPGAMGAGLYLLWPAFYTDVSDSYRLSRRDRLRVDLGGLYFNAVFALGVFAGWGLTGADALLVIIPVQLLQMLRQLTPFVRFDGYHVLADLTGVPDLFARIKPTLRACSVTLGEAGPDGSEALGTSGHHGVGRRGGAGARDVPRPDGARLPAGCRHDVGQPRQPDVGDRAALVRQRAGARRARRRLGLRHLPARAEHGVPHGSGRSSRFPAHVARDRRAARGTSIVGAGRTLCTPRPRLGMVARGAVRADRT